MIIACDPGASGGFAWGTGKEIECAPMPKTLFKLHDLWEKIIDDGPGDNGSVTFWLEQISGFFPQKSMKTIKCYNCGSNVYFQEMRDIMPSSRTLSFGKSIGHVESVAARFGLEINEITPKEWQAICLLGKKGKRTDTEWKRHLKEVALKKYPELGKKITLKTADAVLILHAAWIKENQINF